MPQSAKRSKWASLALLYFSFFQLVTVTLSAQNAPVQPELRAFWADGFSEGFKTPAQVDTLLKRVHDAHLNAVFAQMRKGGDAYYQSHYEPWARDDQSHFDSLAYLIARAHAYMPRITVHAWINTCAVGGNGGNPFNIVHLHPDWLSLNPRGVNFDGEATKIDPGNPDAADWTFRIYLDIARHYDVDGIHFDFVRYGGSDWGYNPISVSRFEQRATMPPAHGEDDVSNTAQDNAPSPDSADSPDNVGAVSLIPGTNLPQPGDPAWKQWRRVQVTDLVRKVYVHAVSINPQIVVSAAVIAWSDGPKTDQDWFDHSAAMNRTMQDWRGWLQEGMIDLACPMTYFRADTHADWQQHWSDFIKARQYHRAATVGVGTWFNTIPDSLKLIQIARSPDRKGRRAYGVMLYSYSGSDVRLVPGPAGTSPATAPVKLPVTTNDQKPVTARSEVTNDEAFYTALSQTTAAGPAPFSADAPIPPMPWKTMPTKGMLKGFLLLPDLAPVDGALITLRGRHAHRVTHSDGTGFYAFVELPPGQYCVQVTLPTWLSKGASRTVRRSVTQKVSVVPQSVTSLQFDLGSEPGIKPDDIRSLVSKDAQPQSSVRLREAAVVIGSDTFPGNIYVADERGVAIRVRLDKQPLLPFQPGDVVDVVGNSGSLEDEPAIVGATARLIDITKSAPTAFTRFDHLPFRNAWPGLAVTLPVTVVEQHDNDLVVDFDGQRLSVPIAGRKEPGVEAGLFAAPSLEAGERIEVSGMLIMPTSGSGGPLKLRLIDPDGIRVMQQSALWRHRKALEVASLIGFRNSNRRRPD